MTGFVALTVYLLNIPSAWAMGVKPSSLSSGSKDDRMNCHECDCTSGGPKVKGRSEPSNCHNTHETGIDF